MKKTVLAAALVALGASLAPADEIKLANGRTLVGIHRRENAPPGKVVVEVGTGTIILNAEDVMSVSPGRTALHDYEDRWAEVKGSPKAADFFALAQWCKENKVSRHVRMLCEKTIALDPEHSGARAELGFDKVGGRWMPFEDAQRAKGFVPWGDRWITPAEKELIEKRRLEAQERAMAAADDKKKKKEEERQRRLQAEEDRRAWVARQLAPLDGYFYQPSEFWPAYFRPYPWASYLRSRRYYQDGWMYQGGGGGMTPTFDAFRFMPDPFKK